MEKPCVIKDFIGQEKIIESLKMLVLANKNTNDNLAHILVSGPSGVGKSTLVEILAKEGGFNYSLFMGPSITTKNDFGRIIDVIRSTENLLLFIDEIHRLPRKIEERLYPVIQDFILPDEDGVNEVLRKFTLVGATTSPGMLKKPMRDRFVHHYNLSYYSLDEMVKIVKFMNPSLSNDMANEVAIRSQGVPRIARRFLTELAVTIGAQNKQKPDKRDIEHTFTRLELDRYGFSRIEREILEYLAKSNKPVGEKTLMSVFELHSDDLIFIHERSLQLHGMLRKTARGREITREGKLYVAEFSGGK